MNTAVSPWTAPRSRRRRASPARTVGRGLRLTAWCLLGLGILFTANWVYQVVRKPSEAFAPVSGLSSKSSRSTWDAYGPLLREHSTSIMTPELLAALAQAEGQGDPFARTYWRWQWSWNPLEIYRPASSAVGMFQITDGTFTEARKYCIHDHTVVRDGPWYDVHSCWFNSLYSRLVPSHAIEMTAAYLHQSVVDVLAKYRVTRSTIEQRQTLAAVIHLCGTRRGELFVKRGFRFLPGETCGSHGVRRYVTRVTALEREFARLQAR